VRLCERNNSAEPTVSAEGGGGGAPGARADVPLQPMEQTMVRQAVPLQFKETPCWSRGMPEGGCHPMGSPRWSRLLAGPGDPWREEHTLEQVCWQGF